MEDNTGKLCPECENGYLEERCLQDDWDGKLTCGYCNQRFPRWTEEDNG